MPGFDCDADGLDLRKKMLRIGFALIATHKLFKLGMGRGGSYFSFAPDKRNAM